MGTLWFFMLKRRKEFESRGRMKRERNTEDRGMSKRKTPGKTEAMWIINLVAYQYLDFSKLYDSQESHN